MSHRKMTPKGGMASSNSGPAIMMMPPHIRATFMPNPPIKPLKPPKRSKSSHHYRRPPSQPPSLQTSTLSGISHLTNQFETTKPPKRQMGITPRSAKLARSKQTRSKQLELLKPLKEVYKDHQKECSGEYRGMNCYNTLFVGRLAYETTERKLLREFEVFGPVKDLKLVVRDKKSRGYAFLEYEREEDMKRAYRAADGMKIDGREIVVDVERGHTVPGWLPRRLGGGLGGTRLGGNDKNYTAPGRFDPSKQQINPPSNSNPMHQQHPSHHPYPPSSGGGPPPGPHSRGPPPPYHGYNNNNGPPPHPHMMDHPYQRGGGGPPPPHHHHHHHPMMDRYGGGGPPGPPHHRYGGGGGGGPPPFYHRGGGPPGPPGGPPMYDDRGGRRFDDRGGGGPNKRFRSGSPPSDKKGSRRRYRD